MSIIKVFYGCDTGVLLSPDPTVFLDDGVAYALVALPNVSAPAGPGGEAIFPILHLTTKRYGDVELTVTPIVDGVTLQPSVVTLAGATPTEGTVDVTEVDLSQAYPSVLDEQIRTAPRGSSIQIRIDAPVTALFDVTVAEVEYEVVRESRLAVTT